MSEKVGLIGIGITPTSLAIAPLVTEAKISDFGPELGRLDHRHQVALHGAGGILRWLSNHGSWLNGRPRTAANVSLP